ncbi:MAG: hypothetical protein GYA55_01185 [SAR324 cluster bacterium]|uniref:Uncharacterized protein n=1 Tax=SAR324 cluster bacterium TaxID=2024889 RepID=A0A7X9FP79_9DELT|nr:hypothetical protein [SAR324 cluster bacterium]
MTIKGKSGIDNEQRRIEQVQNEINLLRKAKKVSAENAAGAKDLSDVIDIKNAQELKQSLETDVTDPAKRARIEELKKQEASGTYVFPKDPEQIQKMIGNMNEEVDDLKALLGE